MSTIEPIEQEQYERMNKIAALIDNALNDNPERGAPRKYGFMLSTFKYGDTSEGRINYISNANRDDMIVALKELLANLEGRMMPPATGQ